MEKVLLHTPEGVRDVYGKECAVKLTIENSINKVFNIYGYHNIQTPTFEFFDIFSKERGSVASKNLYKFFDREGNTLVLRPDVTPSIARLVAKYYMDVKVPVKLCYNANTYINNSELQGKLKENTQLGCELINDDSVEADAEILDNNNITGQLKEAFLKLPELFGSIDVIKSAKELTDNKKALQSIERLEKLYSILEDYGVSKYISFDLGMISNFNYYTGIIFKAYTYGSGDQIVAGGRYDKLLGQFGKEAAAVGFAVYMDQILLAVNGQLLKENNDYSYEVIIYDPEFRKAALSLTNALRDQGVKTELISKKENISLDEYTTFKKEDGATKITYVSKDGAVEL